MKTLDVSAYGVEEMSTQEIFTTDGGGLVGWFVGNIGWEFLKYSGGVYVRNSTQGVYGDMPSPSFRH